MTSLMVDVVVDDEMCGHHPTIGRPVHFWPSDYREERCKCGELAWTWGNHVADVEKHQTFSRFVVITEKIHIDL